jgi:NhaP-type Na+/H+ or K+/H+ antiporter
VGAVCIAGRGRAVSTDTVGSRTPDPVSVAVGSAAGIGGEGGCSDAAGALAAGSALAAIAPPKQTSAVVAMKPALSRAIRAEWHLTESDM